MRFGREIRRQFVPVFSVFVFVAAIFQNCGQLVKPNLNSEGDTGSDSSSMTTKCTAGYKQMTPIDLTQWAGVRAIYLPTVLNTQASPEGIVSMLFDRGPRGLDLMNPSIDSMGPTLVSKDGSLWRRISFSNSQSLSLQPSFDLLSDTITTAILFEGKELSKPVSGTLLRIFGGALGEQQLLITGKDARLEIEVSSDPRNQIRMSFPMSAQEQTNVLVVTISPKAETPSVLLNGKFIEGNWTKTGSPAPLGYVARTVQIGGDSSLQNEFNLGGLVILDRVLKEGESQFLSATLLNMSGAEISHSFPCDVIQAWIEDLKNGSPPAKTDPCANATVKFEKVSSVLTGHRCQMCHDQAVKTYTGIMAWKERDASGKTVVIPKNSSQSSLLQRVDRQPGARPMPPSGLGYRNLDETSIQTLRSWIDQGACE